MTWHATLDLRYTRQHQRTVAHHHHEGPLRMLQSLYPEGDAVCHNVLVHPPGGLVGGDTLTIKIEVQPDAHGLVTTPGATRFYKSAANPPRNSVHARLAAGARLEWLPLEALAYNQCRAENQAVFELAPGAELMGWDVTALGLPEAGLPFVEGTLCATHRGARRLARTGPHRRHRPAADGRPAGPGRPALHGHAVFRGRRPRLNARGASRRWRWCANVIDGHALRATAGATSPHPQVLVLRVLAPLVEPALELLKQARGEWRKALWEMAAVPPRVWAT